MCINRMQKDRKKTSKKNNRELQRQSKTVSVEKKMNVTDVIF